MTTRRGTVTSPGDGEGSNQDTCAKLGTKTPSTPSTDPIQFPRQLNVGPILGHNLRPGLLSKPGLWLFYGMLWHKLFWPKLLVYRWRTWIVFGRLWNSWRRQTLVCLNNTLCLYLVTLNGRYKVFRYTKKECIQFKKSSSLVHV